MIPGFSQIAVLKQVRALRTDFAVMVSMVHSPTFDVAGNRIEAGAFAGRGK